MSLLRNKRKYFIIQRKTRKYAGKKRNNKAIETCFLAEDFNLEYHNFMLPTRQRTSSTTYLASRRETPVRPQLSTPIRAYFT